MQLVSQGSRAAPAPARMLVICLCSSRGSTEWKSSWKLSVVPVCKTSDPLESKRAALAASPGNSDSLLLGIWVSWSGTGEGESRHFQWDSERLCGFISLSVFPCVSG